MRVGFMCKSGPEGNFYPERDGGRGRGVAGRGKPNTQTS